MKPLGMQLTWITVSDIKNSIKFYTEVLGFKLHEFDEQYGWAEVSGKEGARLGLAQYNPEFSKNHKPGENAVVAITVTDIQEACNELKRKKVNLIGDMMEVPGEVKLQTFSDADGNTFQLCQLLK